jgi:hypothetical protein
VRCVRCVRCVWCVCGVCSVRCVNECGREERGALDNVYDGTSRSRRSS